MNELLEMAIRDSYFVKYRRRAAENLTVEAIEEACRTVGKQGTIQDAIALLEKGPKGWRQR